MAPLEPWQRVLVDAEIYPQDVHSYINCTTCHGGNSVDDMELAHTDLIADPANDLETGCVNCHPNLAVAENSLHKTLQGYDTVLYERSLPENHQAIEAMQANHCDSCHATCGDCHVSQPDSVGGGLLDGHVFVQTPPMSQTCTACHGSRVKDEYYGAHEGIPSDVHFRSRMSCVDCHTSNEMHGVDLDADHRYDGAQGPTCESCHQAVVGVGSGIPQHEVHGTELISCQTCHSTTYTNCINCHVDQTDDGVPYFTVEEHFLGFYIGQNPQRNADRPYQYVPLRHVPVDMNSFSFYGEDLLPNFSTLPTWVYTTPHNIQRNTPQTESCLSCHTNDSLFLTPDNIAPEELNANKGVVVESAPELPQGYENIVTGADDGAVPTDGQDDAFWGDDTPPATDGDDSFWGDDGSSDSSSDTNGDDAFWGDDESSNDNDTDNSNTDDDFWATD